MSGGEMHDLIVALIGATVAAALPLAIAAGIRSWRDHALIQDLVLGDPKRGMPPIRDWIEERTQQIQPDTNGGQSLKDLHGKIDDLNSKVDEHIETSKATHDAMWEVLKEEKEHPS